jgi:hypothetical protein
MKIIRFAHLFGNNSEGLNELINAKINKSSEIELCKAVYEAGFDITGGISKQLSKLNYDIKNFYFGQEKLQKLWASENGIKVDEEKWRESIVDSQIEKERPDIIFIQTPSNWILNYIKNKKNKSNKIKLCVAHTVYGGNILDFSGIDLLLVGTPKIVQRYKSRGYNPELFYYYIDQDLLKNFSRDGNKTKKVIFMGSSGFGHGYAHASRYFLLRYLMNNCPIEIWENVVEENSASNLKSKVRNAIKKIVKISGSYKYIRRICRNESSLEKLIIEIENENNFKKHGLKIPDKSLQELFPSRCHRSLFGNKYYEVISESEMCFHKGGDNTHDDVHCLLGNAGALRMFETTGLGTTLVSNSASNNKDLFEENYEIVTYSCKEDACEKIKFLLENPDQCRQIGMAGLKKCNEKHSSKERAIQLDCLIREGLRKKGAGLDAI